MLNNKDGGKAMAKYNYYLFDLDGTLTDSELGITNSVKHALRKYGIEGITHLCAENSLYQIFVANLIFSTIGRENFSCANTSPLAVKPTGFYCEN